MSWLTMKLAGPVLAAGGCAFIAFAVSYACEPAGSAVGRPVVATFLVVVSVGVVLSALAALADWLGGRR